jgi:hypothetical protein
MEREATCPLGANGHALSDASEEQARDVLEMLREEGLFQRFTFKAEGHGPWTHTVEVFGGAA